MDNLRIVEEKLCLQLGGVTQHSGSSAQKLHQSLLAWLLQAAHLLLALAFCVRSDCDVCRSFRSNSEDITFPEGR